MADGDVALLSSLFGDEDDFDLSFFSAVAKSGAGGDTTDADIEAMMREQWGLPAVSIDREIASIESGRAVVPDDQDEDDYTEDEWLIVRTMRQFCLDAIHRGTTAARRKRAITWLFVRGTKEQRYDSEFHLACDMLKARPWVVQALIQHLWFQREISPGTIPFLADPLPEALQSEAIMRAWEPGMQIMSVLWRWPGMPLHAMRDLVPELSDSVYDQALASLCDSGLIGTVHGHGYVTSRPATFRRTRGNVSWARSFIGE